MWLVLWPKPAELYFAKCKYNDLAIKVRQKWLKFHRKLAQPKISFNLAEIIDNN